MIIAGQILEMVINPAVCHFAICEVTALNDCMVLYAMNIPHAALMLESTCVMTHITVSTVPFMVMDRPDAQLLCLVIPMYMYI